jgi:transmembrane sensor
MDKKELAELSRKYLSGKATEKELELLHEWYNAADREEIELIFTEQPESEEDIRRRVLSKLLQVIEKDELGQREEKARERITGDGARSFQWMAAATVIMLMLCGAGYYWVRQHSSIRQTSRIEPAAKQYPADLSPGGDKAKLVLGDGTVIALEDAKDGTIKEEAGTSVNKHDGQLIYAARRGNENKGEIPFNTIVTPRGGQYQVVLPDGSKVWLNAASSLRFPTAFTGGERNVELKGEAYFEIAESKDAPFKVSIPQNGAGEDMRVEVLGTHFNLTAYSDESTINTTLLEGAVKVVKGKAVHVLRAGQQASLNKETGSFKIMEADTDEAVAWKNGLFQFEGATIGTVMKQIARWYDVDVEYKGVILKHFRGIISRSVNVSQVFKMLELTGEVHFRIEGKKIIVMP